MSSQISGSKVVTCDKLSKGHIWIWKGETKDTEYMVCQKCGIMPGGNFEEK